MVDTTTCDENHLASSHRHRAPAPAEAHLNSTGMGPIYDGITHFLLSPDDLVPALAVAMLAGLRGASYGRRVMFVLPAAWPWVPRSQSLRPQRSAPSFSPRSGSWHWADWWRPTSRYPCA